MLASIALTLALPLLGAFAAPAVDVAQSSSISSDVDTRAPKLDCGSHAEILKPSFLYPLHPAIIISSFHDCKAECLGTKTCQSFLWNEPSILCVQYNEVLPPQKPLYLEALPGRIYDRRCFD